MSQTAATPGEATESRDAEGNPAGTTAAPPSAATTTTTSSPPTPPAASPPAAPQNGNTGNATGTEARALTDAEEDVESGKRYELTGEKIAEIRRKAAEKSRQQVEARYAREQQDRDAAAAETRRQEEEAAAIQRGEHEQVINNQRTELETLRGQVRERDERITSLTAYEEAVGRIAKQEMTGLPDGVRELLAKQSPLEQMEWLGKHKAEYAPQPKEEAQTQPGVNGTGTTSGAGTGAAAKNGQVTQGQPVPTTPRSQGQGGTSQAAIDQAEAAGQRHYKSTLF
jgi:hypothetical protein